MTDLFKCNQLPTTSSVTQLNYTGRFIMSSVITNIYDKETKGSTLMELFTATGKLKKFFFYNKRCSMCAPRLTWHTSIRYSSSCKRKLFQFSCGCENFH